MTDFERLLCKAVNGDNEAMAEILLLVEPIITRNSRIFGREDEDLRQNIILQIIVATKNWKGVEKNEG